MRNTASITLAALLISGSLASAQTFSFAANNIAVPDADANGLALPGEVNGLAGTNYQAFSPVYNSTGQLTGNWGVDGRNIDPASTPGAFDTTTATATFASFNGTDPNGTWVLFVADFSSGGHSTVNHWGLNLGTTVPEPSSFSLNVGGVGLLVWLARRRRTR